MKKAPFVRNYVSKYIVKTKQSTVQANGVVEGVKRK